MWRAGDPPAGEDGVRLQARKARMLGNDDDRYSIHPARLPLSPPMAVFPTLELNAGRPGAAVYTMLSPSRPTANGWQIRGMARHLLAEARRTLKKRRAGGREVDCY